MSDLEWRQVCEVSALDGRRRCRQLFAKKGKPSDLVLINYQGQYHALEAWCAHYGGPLHQGDIEDYKGSLHITCPWHGYKYKLNDGTCELGIKQEVYETKVEDEKLFVKYSCDLQLEPYTS